MQLKLEKSAVQPRKAGPLPNSAETPFEAPTPVFRASNRETDEGYGAVVAVLNPKLRVIRGSCGLQWILQRRRNPLTWTSFAFCQTKAGLLMRIKDQLQRKCKQTLSLDRLVGRYCASEEWSAIEVLPDFKLARTRGALLFGPGLALAASAAKRQGASRARVRCVPSANLKRDAGRCKPTSDYRKLCLFF
jgi:hypothetical protein